MELKRGIAVAALHHPEVGDIDLVYGEYGDTRNSGYGLAKIAEKHPEVIDKLQEVINECKVKQKDERVIQLTSKKYKAAVKLYLDTNNGKEKKLWLLTAFLK